MNNQLNGIAVPDVTCVVIRTLLLVFALPIALLAADEIIRVEADAQKGFQWPYFLSVPKNPVKPAFLLVEPNNMGRSSDDPKVHEDDARAIIGVRISDSDFKKLGSPILVPAFPRPKTNWKLYTHALNRDTLTTGETRLRRIDLQLIAMISDARKRLAKRGLRVQSKVFLWGYSAAGTFTSRFLVIHPKIIQAAAFGGCSLPILPVEAFNGRRLRYPIGVGDLRQLTGKRFDANSFRKVPIQIFRGDEDTNDEVAYDDGYEPVDRELINTFIAGPPPIHRYPVIETIYRQFGSIAQFVIEPGIGHDDTRIRRESVQFFNQHRR